MVFSNKAAHIGSIWSRHSTTVIHPEKLVHVKKKKYLYKNVYWGFTLIAKFLSRKSNCRKYIQWDISQEKKMLYHMCQCGWKTKIIM